MSDVIRLATENYVNQEIPTKVSELENDSGYVTKASFTAVIGQTTYEELSDAINKGYSVFAHGDGITLPMTMQIPASKSTTPYPAYMKGYKHVTISDFVDLEGKQMTNYYGDGNAEGVLYKYYLPSTKIFDNTMISMRVTWNEGTYKNRIDIGGSGDWKGFSLNPNEDGSKLELRDNYNMTDSGFSFDMTSDVAGVSSFLNNELLLQIGFSYGSTTNSGSWLTLKIYINGVLYNNKSLSIPHISIGDLGTRLNIYQQTDTAVITLWEVEVEDWIDIIQFTSVLKYEKEYYVLETNCNHLPDGSTIWILEKPIKIPQDYVTHKTLNQTLEEKSIAYKQETVLPNSNFYLREKGLYIICGYGYNLNLYNASGELQGEDNCLSIIIFCTEADANGNFSVFAMQNYKSTLGVSSIKSLVLPGLNGNAYIKNTNTNEGSTVYYMRQNEV